MLAELLQLSRNLRRSPASAVAAVLTLSLTLGAGAAIFAVVDAVLLTPPPFTDPEALVLLTETPMEDRTAAPRPVSFATLQAWRERAGTMAAIEARDGTNLTLTGVGAAVRINAINVTPGVLPLLGIAPARGRGFVPDDAGQRVAVISHEFWRATLAADPNVLTREIVLGGQPHTIIGVLPDTLTRALSDVDVWRPFPRTAQGTDAGFQVRPIARLAPGITPAALGLALDEVSRSSTPAARVTVTPFLTARAGDATRTLGLLLGAAVIAMLIAGANLAGLLIVRTLDRRRELAVRCALGARRSQIARHVLLETLALVAIGTAGGVLLATWMTPAVGRLALEQFGSVANREIAVNWRVIAAMLLAAAVCAVVCGSLPAFIAARRSVVDVLRRGATAAPRELSLRRAFVIGEVALAFVLLVTVMLLGRSLVRVLDTHPGFEANGLLTLGISLPAAAYPDGERIVGFYSTLSGALEERLGPGTASLVDEMPLTGDRGRRFVSARPNEPGREAVVRSAGNAYFEVMRIPLRAGRSFDRNDDGAAPARVVLSASLAERLFPGGAPAIGRYIWLDRAQRAEVVGVAGDVTHRALDDPIAPTVYMSAWQAPSNTTRLVVRTGRPDADVIAAVREEVARLDRDLPVYGISSMADMLARSPGVPVRRVLTATFMGFALLAVALGAIGLFGVVAHDVARRRAELALRMALGANPVRILRATLGQGAVMIGVGLAAGGVLSIWASRALGSLIFGINPFDVVSLGAAAGVLALTGLSAVLPAARRAARTDPVTALRSE